MAKNDFAAVKGLFGDEMRFPWDEVLYLPWSFVAGMTLEERKSLAIEAKRRTQTQRLIKNGS